MVYYACVQLKPSNGHKKNRYEKAPMNLLTDDLFKVYRKFLAAAFGSARITSIYSVVDAAMVGKCHGPDRVRRARLRPFGTLHRRVPRALRRAGDLVGDSDGRGPRRRRNRPDDQFKPFALRKL